jgi:hypothetical protein
MPAVQAMRKLGFRKWYERTLLRSHLHLVLLLLSTVGLLGCAEVWRGELALLDHLWLLACVVASALIGLRSLRRYLYLLRHAEYVADQAVCRRCEAYARWDITGEDAPNGRMQVCCRRCGHHWKIAL